MCGHVGFDGNPVVRRTCPKARTTRNEPARTTRLLSWRGLDSWGWSVVRCVVVWPPCRVRGDGEAAPEPGWRGGRAAMLCALDGCTNSTKGGQNNTRTSRIWTRMHTLPMKLSKRLNRHILILTKLARTSRCWWVAQYAQSTPSTSLKESADISPLRKNRTIYLEIN